MRLLAALVLANLACVTTREPQPLAISASQLLHEHWNAPTGSDERFRGSTAVIGLLARRLEVTGKGTALDLQTNERSYFVRCWLTSDASAASTSLEREQLVMVRGEGAGMNKDAPELTSCTVSWRGDPPRSRPEDFARSAAVTAASVKLCAAEANGRSLADVLEPVKTKERHAQLKARNQAVLTNAGAAALPCDHPLVALVTRCARRDVFKPAEPGSECAATQVKDALEQLWAQSATSDHG